MSTRKIKTGLETNRLSYTPVEGEMLFVTDTSKVYIGDGSTAGGIPLNLSSSEILSELISVDGPSSGLDADTLDGLEGSQFLRNDQDGSIDGTLTSTDLSYTSISDIPNSNTITDVFVYDTSKDSDGGAWRYKTAHTSWYNETLNTSTRGTTKEFPSMTLIVSEANTITIYDLTDPDVPMWMVFDILDGNKMLFISGSPVSAKAKMLNGLFVSGTTATTVGYITTVNFISEDASLWSSSTLGPFKYRANGIVDRNNTEYYATSQAITLVAGNIIDFSMKVLKTDRIDESTGLPIPSIVCAIAGGLTVITNNESTTRFITAYEIKSIMFDSDDRIIYFRSGSSAIYRSIDYINNIDFEFYTSATIPAIGSGAISNSNERPIAIIDNEINLGEEYISGSKSVSLLKFRPNDIPEKGMINYIDTDYQTGWMYGDIKGSFLSTSTNTNIEESGELVLNGTFGSSIVGWTAGALSGGTASTLSLSGNKLRILNSGATYGTAEQSIPTTIGKTYVLSVDTFNLGEAGYQSVRLGTTAQALDLNNVSSSVLTDGVLTLTIVAQSSTTYITLVNRNDSNSFHEYDNISFKFADVDRSHNQKGLYIDGNINRVPVATGAELQSYKNFSSDNYLTQHHNEDLNFNTSEFNIMGWVKFNNSNGTAENIISLHSNSGDNDYISIQKQTNGQLRFELDFSASGAQIVNANDIGKDWAFICGIVKSNSMELYVNGTLIDSDNRTIANDPFDYITGNLYIGAFNPGAADYRPMRGELSLWRIGAGAPTSEDIKYIYESEKYMFSENAKCTLSSSSKGIKALSYNADTEILHVAGTTHLDEFSGLVRTSSEVGAYTSISSSKNIISKGN